MRLAITVDALDRQLGGIGRYTLELCRGLARHRAVRDLRFYRNGRWIAEPETLLHGEEIEEMPPRFLPKRWHQRWTDRREQQRYEKYLFHGTNFFLPARAQAGVITVHDLSVVRFPQFHPPERVRAFEDGFAQSLARAAHVITPSDTIRQELMDVMGCKADRITAIPLAAGANYRPRSPAEVNPLLSSWGLQAGGYGLSVATIEPRKKLEQSLQAWERLPVAVRRRWPLVIVGGDGWHNQAIRAKILRGEEEGWVRSLGYVSEEMLPGLYAGARLLVYPSSYEGFGLPAVESMASGTPCIVSQHSCLVEVTRGAAMQVDPDDLSSYSSGIERGLTDEGWRAQATSQGLCVAASYSWEKCVSQTLDVYKKVLAEVR